MIETINLTEFDKLNRATCRALIGSWSHPDLIDEIYFGFLASLFKQNALAKFDKTRAKFATYISKCLRNYISVHIHVSCMERICNEGLDNYTETPDTSESVSTDFRKDLYGFYKYFKARMESCQNKELADRELAILKALYKGQTPAQISKSLKITVCTVYVARQKFNIFYKNFLKT